MPCSAPDSFPATITAGDSLAWSLALPDYPPTAGWTLHYGAAGPQAVNFDATASGSTYAVTVSPDTTAAWLPGRYVFAAYVTRNTPTAERHTLFRGGFTILPDPAATSIALSHAQEALALLEAAILGRIPRGLEETTIDGQMISRTPLGTLITLRDKYRVEVGNLERAAAAAAGVRRSTTISVRFVG